LRSCALHAGERQRMLLLRRLDRRRSSGSTALFS
jgi:hypothetical protein